MADDNHLRSYRSNEPYRRASGTGEQAGSSDPLAELARLIGQSDPFAEQRRSSRQAEPAPRAPSTAPQWPPGPSRAHHARETYADSDAYSRSHHAHSHAAESYSQAPSRSQPPSRHDAYADDERQGYAGDDRRYAQSSYADPQAEGDHRLQTYADEHGSYGAAELGHEHGQENLQEAGHESGQQGGHAEDHYYQDDVPLEPHEDEMYDDAPRARRHGGLVTALVLIGCAMLGTAGAYGYRTYYTNPDAQQPVPVITADSAMPPKVVPTTAIDPQASKAMDRLATAAGSEQLVRRQEEPVVLRELGTANSPRVVLPASGAPTQAAPSQNAPAATGSTNSGEPKRVRTVTIRPDGTDLSGRPVGAPPTAPRAATTTPPAPRAAPTAPTRGGPVSLDPQGQPTETAALPAARARAPAATESPTSTGGYLVQLASQKSETEAQSAFRSLQAKFPNELGSRQPVIRKADLGSKGVFYRTMVGPFRSAQEASQFCASYKAAGGQCVVPNN